MTRHRSHAQRAASALAVVLACAALAEPADTVSGKASLNAQAIDLAHGFAFLGPRKDVNVGLFAATPSAADTATAVRDGIDSAFGVTSPAKGAYVLLKLNFPKGATRADHVDMCEIDFYNFADSPEQTMWLGADQCGVVEIGGDLEPGGVVHGRLKGPAEPPRGKKYTWDLVFSTTLQAGK